jgi:hypothetical protein
LFDTVFLPGNRFKNIIKMTEHLNRCFILCLIKREIRIPPETILTYYIKSNTNPRWVDRRDAELYIRREINNLVALKNFDLIHKIMHEMTVIGDYHEFCYLSF